MFVKTKWFRLILAFAVALGLAIFGLVVMNIKTDTGILGAVQKYSVMGWEFNDGFLLGLMIVFFAADYFLFFLANDFGYFLKNRLTKLQMVVGLIGIIFMLGAVVIQFIVLFGYTFDQSYMISSDRTEWVKTVKGVGDYTFYRISPATAFAPALFLMPFVVAHMLMGIINSVALSKGGNWLVLTLEQPVGLIGGYFIGYALVCSCSGFLNWLAIAFLVLFLPYFFFVEIGIRRERDSNGGVSVSGSADKVVAGAAQKVARSFRTRTQVSSAGVFLWIKPRVSVGSKEVTFYMDYYFEGMEKLKSQSDAIDVQNNFNYEINTRGNKLLNKAVDAVKSANPSAGYSVNVVSGSNLKG